MEWKIKLVEILLINFRTVDYDKTPGSEIFQKPFATRSNWRKKDTEKKHYENSW